MSALPVPSASASAAIAAVREAFEGWSHEFRRLTVRARDRFERREWLEGQRDSVARLGSYQLAVAQAVDRLTPLVGRRQQARAMWSELRDGYLHQVSARPDAELALTFFSSVARRFFDTVGVDPEIEFLHVSPHPPEPSRVTRRFPCENDAVALMRDVLDAYRFGLGYDNLARDAELAGQAIRAMLGDGRVEAAEIALPVFFRNKGAYLVGRLLTSAGPRPLVLAMLNDEEHGGVTVDAVLLTEDDVSIVFSYTRSYFAVATERPRDLVAFLQLVLPVKPVADLYNAIGYHKRGKTELYRSLRQQQQQTTEAFGFAPGARGMVMVVFTMPSSDQVFKVFRDRFDYPKTITRADAMAKYQLVFEHDRAGRLVDAHEFHDLEFERRRFSPELLDELDREARESVEIRDRTVVLRHVYVERRVTPLDVYLRTATLDESIRAVLDYGATVRDLAATNIFPGDLLLKNFGVTRHGRVVFYDYDEIARLTDCRFRRVPAPRDLQEELSPLPWFAVSEGDVFPEEFGAFLGLTGVLREQFLAVHGHLLDTEFWTSMQRALRSGTVVDIFPYPPDKRLAFRQSQPSLIEVPSHHV